MSDEPFHPVRRSDLHYRISGDRVGAILMVAEDWAWGRITFDQASADFLQLRAVAVTVTERATGKQMNWVRD